MIVLLIFAFLSGLVTIAAPCIWPLLPIILSSSATGGHRRPLGITLGIISSFTILTLTIAYIVRIIPFDPEILRYIAVFVIGLLGLSLIIPQLGAVIEGAVSRLSSKLGPKTSTNDNGFRSGLLTGLSLGIVWTPCAGPILATIATLAATQSVNFSIILVTLVYVAGVGIPLFVFATIGQKLFTKTKSVNKYTGVIQRFFGVLMVLTALSILSGYDRIIQANLLDKFPSYSNFLLKLENNGSVQKELSALRGNKNVPMPTMKFPKAGELPKLQMAPDFVGIEKWLNTDKNITLKDLKGKVVLIDFWTYTCINCIRTLPYITSWYAKYKDQGFVVIGVHTPEFEFEKKTENVTEAMKQYGITYPVGQDNNYQSWRAFDNHYWPAHYLIDADGYIRAYHFGEGNYEETEKNIQLLLSEAGRSTNQELTKEKTDGAMGEQTPETYLGLARMEFFASPEKPKLGWNVFSTPAMVPENFFAYSGTWDLLEEYATVNSGGASITEHFQAKDVYLVITPAQYGGTVSVMLDGKPIGAENAGKDVGASQIVLDKARLYHIVHLEDASGSHILKLTFDTAGTQVFAFTFGS